MSKRSYGAAFLDEAKLRIKLSNTEPGKHGTNHEVIEADKQIIGFYSTSARGLPETDEWDLSKFLLVDGQPVSRATVVAWLNAAYQHAYKADFEQQQDNPAHTFEGLYRLLEFANAIGTLRGVLEACCLQLAYLQLHGQLGQATVALHTDGSEYGLRSITLLDIQLRQRSDISAETSVRCPAALVEASAEEQQAFKQQVAAQTEQLLWLAYRLQLKPLIQRLHNFIRAVSMFDTSLLYGALDDVITPRVLEAAGSHALSSGKQVLLNSILGEALAFTGVPGVQTVLQPAVLSTEQQAPIRFNAVVHRTTLNLPQGATVPVELDLFGESTIRLGQSTFPLQLRIGSSFGPM